MWVGSDLLLLASRMEGGTASQGEEAASGSWRRPGNRIPAGSLQGGTEPCRLSQHSPLRPSLDF